MPRIKRWFKVNEDFNSDGDLWEMRNKIGERSLGIWLEFCAMGNRNAGALPLLSDCSATTVAFKCHSSATRVRLVWDFALTKAWIVCDPTPRLTNYPYGKESREQNESLGGNATLLDKTRQDKTRREKNKEQPPVAIVPPDWLPKEIWDDYCEHRKNKRAKVTPLAAKRLFEQLDQLRVRGFDPAYVLNRSIANGWTGVFEPQRQEEKPEDKIVKMLNRGLT